MLILWPLYLTFWIEFFYPTTRKSATILKFERRTLRS